MNEQDRSESQPPNRRRGAVAVICCEERLLVIRRSRFVAAPLSYCFPGGGIEPGEDSPQAVRRELWEELAAEVIPHRMLWHCVTSWNVELEWWLTSLRHDGPLRPDPNEVDSYDWLSAADIRRLPTLLESNHWFLDAWQRGEFEL